MEDEYDSSRHVAELVLSNMTANARINSLELEVRSLRCAIQMQHIQAEVQPFPQQSIRPQSAAVRGQTQSGAMAAELASTKDLLREANASLEAHDAMWESERSRYEMLLATSQGEIDKRNVRISDDVLNRRLLMRIDQASRKYGKLRTMRASGRARLEAVERGTMECHDDQRFVRMDQARHVPVDDVTIVVVCVPVASNRNADAQLRSLVTSLCREHSGALSNHTATAYMMAFRNVLDALMFSRRLKLTLQQSPRWEDAAATVRIGMERCRPETAFNPASRTMSYVGPAVAPAIRLARWCHPGEVLLGPAGWAQAVLLDATVDNAVMQRFFQTEACVIQNVSGDCRSVVVSEKTWDYTTTRTPCDDVLISWWSHKPQRPVDMDVQTFASPDFIRRVELLRKTSRAAMEKVEKMERNLMEACDAPHPPIFSPARQKSGSVCFCVVRMRGVAALARKISQTSLDRVVQRFEVYVATATAMFQGNQILAFSGRSHVLFPNAVTALGWAIHLQCEFEAATCWPEPILAAGGVGVGIILAHVHPIRSYCSVSKRIELMGVEVQRAKKLGTHAAAGEILCNDSTMAMLRVARVSVSSAKVDGLVITHSDLNADGVWGLAKDSSRLQRNMQARTLLRKKEPKMRCPSVDGAISHARMMQEEVELRERTLMSIHDHVIFGEALIPVGRSAVVVMFDIDGAQTFRETASLTMPFRVTVSDYRTVVRSHIQLCNAFELKNEADCFIVIFHNIRDATEFCCGIQVQLNSMSWHADMCSHELSLRVRDTATGGWVFNGPRVRMAVCGGSFHGIGKDGAEAYYDALSAVAWKLVSVSLGGEILLNERAYEELCLLELQSRSGSLRHVVLTPHGKAVLDSAAPEQAITSMIPTTLISRVKQFREFHSRGRASTLRKPWSDKAVSSSPSLLMKQRKDLEQDLNITVTDSELIILSDMMNALTRRIDELTRYTHDYSRNVDIFKVLGHVDQVMRFVSVACDSILPVDVRISRGAIAEDTYSLQYAVITKRLLEQYDEMVRADIDFQSLRMLSTDLTLLEECPTCKRQLHEKSYSKHEFKPSTKKEVTYGEILDVLTDYAAFDEAKSAEVGFEVLKKLFSAKRDAAFDAATFSRIDKDGKGSVTPFMLVRFLYPAVKVSASNTLVKDAMKELGYATTTAAVTNPKGGGANPLSRSMTHPPSSPSLDKQLEMLHPVEDTVNQPFSRPPTQPASKRPVARRGKQ